MKRTGRSPLFLMALTVFIDFTGFGLIIPLLPFWARHLGANAFGVGLVLTVYALAQFVFTPVLGAISDRHGRRPVIIWSLAIEVVSLVLTALAGSLPLLLLARSIGGLGASNLGSAQAVVADTTPPERRARAMGHMGAAIGLGFVLGPAMGGALAILGLTVPLWVAAALALGNALLVWRLLPESNPAVVAATAGASPARAHAMPSSRRMSPHHLLSGWRGLATRPVAARLVAVNFLFTAAFAAMEAVFPLLTLRYFGWHAAANGYLFAYVGVIVVIMQGGLVGRLVRRYGEPRLLLAGLVLLAVGLALLPVAHAVGPVLIALAALSIGDGAVTPTLSALLSTSSDAASQGEMLGLSQGAAGLGRVIGPLGAGALFAWSATAPFAAASLVALAGLAVLLPALPNLRRARARQSAQRPQSASGARWSPPGEHISGHGAPRSEHARHEAPSASR